MKAKTEPRQIRAGRPSAEEAAQVGDRLLDAAAALFQENGYARTTMDGIARKAQASTKTVYLRYRNKPEILAAVIRRLIDRTGASTDIGATEIDGHDPESALRGMGLRFAMLASAQQTVVINRLVIAEAMQFPELVSVYAEGPERARSILRSALEQWRREGKLPLMPRPDAAATIFFEMATSTPRMRALLGTAMPREALEEHIVLVVTLFLRGCGCAPTMGFGSG
jgi:AcrR family transcriptional regulator